MAKSEHQVQRNPESGCEGFLFKDRADAGVQLAAQLEHMRGRDPLVIGIARGGVVVAREVAKRLDADLDVFVVRKLSAPGQPELAIGALTADGTYHLDRELVIQLGVSNASVVRIAELQSREAQRLEQALRGGRPPIDVAGRTVILVDDGLATGATLRVAIHAIALQGAKHVIVAVPVGAYATCRELEPLVEELVCPNQLESFHAVGDYYRDFDATSDTAVLNILQQQIVHRVS